MKKFLHAVLVVGLFLGSTIVAAATVEPAPLWSTGSNADYQRRIEGFAQAGWVNEQGQISVIGITYEAERLARGKGWWSEWMLNAHPANRCSLAEIEQQLNGCADRPAYQSWNFLFLRNAGYANNLSNQPLREWISPKEFVREARAGKWRVPVYYGALAGVIEVKQKMSDLEKRLRNAVEQGDQQVAEQIMAEFNTYKAQVDSRIGGVEGFSEANAVAIDGIKKTMIKVEQLNATLAARDELLRGEFKSTSSTHDWLNTGALLLLALLIPIAGIAFRRKGKATQPQALYEPAKEEIPAGKKTVSGRRTEPTQKRVSEADEVIGPARVISRDVSKTDKSSDSADTVQSFDIPQALRRQSN